MNPRKIFSIVLISIVLGVLNCSAKNIVVFGTVTDADCEPLIGVSVVDNQSHKGVTTDIDGNYRIEIATEAGVIITFSYVGMESVDLKVAVASDEKIQHDVVLKNSANVLSEVVVTGMFTRPTDTFTGSSTVYSVERLAESGNQNILSSLRSVDPSFAIDNNLATGSNPNTMPNLQIRGATSINIKGDYEGNSNQPLLILDGFETPLEKLFDMDMDRVASITILKDASAKAIYGSKAGNGVIVVETRRPSIGSPTVYYTGTLNFDTPDISSYNLMDASTKLNFEVARGMYDRAATYEQLQQQHDLLKVYRDNIARGVDTDWLSLATHTGIGTKHAVAVEGGSEHWRYQGGAMYNAISGVMKGSDRNILNINGLVLYDNNNFRIRNAIDFTNTDAHNSPLGEFSEFLNLNPYLMPYADDGTPMRIIAYGENDFPVYNPLYNASLNTLNKEAYWELRNNFSVDWQLHRLLKLTANFSYTYKRTRTDYFLPEGNTELEKPDSEGRYFLNGRYDMTKSVSHTYAGNLGFNYNQSIGKHAWFVNTNVNIQSSHLRRHNYTTIDSDLGNSSLLSLADASQWLTERFYDGADDRRREIGFIAATSYAFDNRYLLDTSVRESGSSVFGSENRWGCFWSVGIGWNLHNERFLSSLGWLKQLKL
ncbi:MAG: SusC/RagA family TonB-linked outer membrane protein, partial [Muribaculaceae bacterium]